MTIVEQLVSGLTYEGYETLFSKNNLANHAVNDSLAVIIDYSICNFRVTPNDDKAIQELKLHSIDKHYEQLVSDVFNTIINSGCIYNESTLNLFRQITI